MASTSTSSIKKKSFKYDVFLSFRGEDTRKSFIDHLYHALQQKNIHTYKDDERIGKGKRISDELITSIEDSKFYIIVFSRNYASSCWCLDELVKIMECQKAIEHTAYPVFYDVEPTEVRKQIGSVGEAFGKHEKEEAAGKWRDALKEAADLAGWELKNTFNGHEAKLIQEIVQDISLELRFTDSGMNGKLVGMETRVKDIISSLETCDDDVCMLGIKGMGGAGKTTLARAVFDQISVRFEGSSFVENVREVSKGSLFGLKELQKQVLSDILNDKDITVSGVYDGENKMKTMIQGRKVLVVLDDVDRINQLDALAGEPIWFKAGSKIIITTRDEQVLVAHGVNLIRNVDLLSHKEAICLFNRYAFLKGIPVQGYEELSREVLHYAAGLPLSIRVLGSFLCGKDELEWKDALDRLKTIPLKETLEILELSYIDLEEDYREIFLDVVCILKGKLKEFAIRVLESCGFNARYGLGVLEQKSLITIDVYGCLDMHDHIEEMGQNIVRLLHPNEPCRHSRLWHLEEIKDILVNDLGTEATKCIKLWNIGLDPNIIMKGLGNMKKLRLLYVRSYYFVNYRESCELSHSIPNSLQYLHWSGYPFTYLPKNFQPNNLVGFEMSRDNLVQLWEGGERKVFKKLRFIVFEVSKLTTLDLGLTPVLETLNLRHCANLVELHLPVGSPKLKVIDLYHCKLRTLDLGLTHNLETLRIVDYGNLVELHMPDECSKLNSINLSCSKLRTLDLRLIRNLERLRIEYCGDLVELHMPVESPKLEFFKITRSKLRTLDLGLTRNLETLKIKDCGDLIELRMPSESPKLESFKIYHSKLRTLDLRMTHNLKSLNIKDCGDLVELHMPVESPKLEFFKISFFKITHSKLRTLDLGLTRNLETLVIEDRGDLVELNMPGECLKLKSINLSHSKLRTLDLRLTRNLETIRIRNCGNLEELHMPVESLKLEFFEIYQSKLRTLDLVPIRNLKALEIEDCADLIELQLPGESPKLENFKIYHSKLRTLDLRMTRNLKTLQIDGCGDLVELHMPVESPKLVIFEISHCKLRTLDLGLTRNLETLEIEDCGDIAELHIPVESSKLKSINLSHSKLRTLDLGVIRNLETLRIEDCGDLVELHMPVESPKLRLFKISHSKLRTLDLGLTHNLKSLKLEDCGDLVELHLPGECPKLEFMISRSKLRTLDVRLTRNLEALIIEDCGDLVELHMPVESLKLKCIGLFHSKLRTLDLRMTRNLKTLQIDGCCDLVELHMPIESPKLKNFKISRSKLRTIDLGLTHNLETLEIEDCGDLVELHMPGESSKLRSINLSHSKLMTLDLRLIRNLEILRIEDCGDLAELHMPVESPKLKFLMISHSKLRTLDLGLTLNLMTLYLKDCYNLVELHVPFGCLKKLLNFDLSGCLRFKSFLVNEMCLEPYFLAGLCLIAEAAETCVLHSDSNLPKFTFECFYGAYLPSLAGNLEKLISFGLCACTDLERFSGSICSLQNLRKLTLKGSIPEAPRDLGHLQCLEELVLSCAKIRYLPDSICMLKNLTLLKLESCWQLEKLPENLGRLESLEDLYLTECIFLRDLPRSICEMKRLKHFHLPYCFLVEKLPEEVGRLECLKELNIEDAGITRLPQTIFGLKGLRILGRRRQLESCGFTSVMQHPEHSRYTAFCYI